MPGENWVELSEFLGDAAWSTFKQLEPKDGPRAQEIAALRRDLPEVADYVIESLVSLGWEHFLVWLSTPANRARLAGFLNRTEYPWLSWWQPGNAAAPDAPQPGPGAP